MATKGETTRAYIRSVAYDLFAEKGFKEVTMKDIYTNAKLSSGGLYRHYGGTSEVFSDIVNEIMIDLKTSFTEKITKDMPATQILNEFLDSYQAEMLDLNHSLGLAIYEYFSSVAVAGENLLWQQYKASQDALCELLQYGIRTGEFNPVDCKAVVNLLIFSYQGVRMWSKLIPIETEVPVGIINELKNVILKKG